MGCVLLAVSMQSLANLLQKYMQTQGLVGTPAITSGISILVDVGASWAGALLFGLDGVALAATATRVFLLMAMLIAVAFSESRQRWQQQRMLAATESAAEPDSATDTAKPGNMWLQAETWKSGWELFVHNAARLATLKAFFELGLPGGIALGLEAAAFEVTTAFAGFLGSVAVTAHAGVFSLTSLNYLALPFALATAATIRVGNLVGAGEGNLAAVSSKLVVMLGSSFMAMCGLAIYLGRYKLGLLFTTGDVEVLKAVALIAPLGAMYQVRRC